VNYTVVQSFDANLQASINECNGIDLTWDTYPESDFVEYVINYADRFDEIGDCNENQTFSNIQDVNNTSFTIDETAETANLCFSIQVSTNAGLTPSQEVNIAQPFEGKMAINEIQRTTLVNDNNIYFDNARNAGFDNKLCFFDATTTSFSCNSLPENSEMVFAGEVDNEFAVVLFDGNLRLMDENLQLKSILSNANIAPPLHVTPNGMLVGIDNNNFTGIRIADFNSQTVSNNNIPITGDILGFTNAPAANQFGILTFEFDLINPDVFTNKWTLYSMIDQDNIQEELTVVLDYPFAVGQYSVSPNGQYLLLENGKVYDLSQNPVAEYNLSTVNGNIFSQSWVSNDYALLVDESQGKWEVFQLSTQSLVNSFDQCLGGIRPAGITNDGKIIISKSSLNQDLLMSFRE